jgi:hypothetical protein
MGVSNTMPKKPTTKPIQVYVSEDLYLWIQQQATDHCQSMSAYMLDKSQLAVQHRLYKQRIEAKESDDEVANIRKSAIRFE